MFPLSHFSILSTIPQTYFQGIFQVRIDGGPVYRVYCDDRQGMGMASLRQRRAKTVRGHSSGRWSILKITKMDRNPMKRKANISHDEAIMRRLRKNPDFAAAYLKSALQDEDGPRVLFIASSRPS